MPISDQKSFSKGEVVVLLSGGLDSTVALAATLKERSVACALTFDYGQRAVSREIDAASAIASYYNVAHRVIALPWLSELLPEAMNKHVVGPSERFSSRWTELDEESLYDVRRVWVPNRNGVFLNIAACYAEALGASTLVFGANAEEGASFPDNTPEFRDSLTAAFAYSTLSGVEVETPVANMRKDAIVALGHSLNVPLSLIWSCYEGTEQPCNVCPSCLRLHAAKAAQNVSARY